MSNILSERITALRKERGLTQEQLGQLVGVSAQAVSKWEKGGAPDVELLPVLADRLGVTLDGLFGRDSGPAVDIKTTLHQWLISFPVNERIGKLYQLLATLFSDFYISPMEFSASLDSFPYIDDCYASGVEAGFDQPTWLRSYSCMDSGLCMGVMSKNLPVYLLMPEPPEGYDRHLASNEQYRSLFQVLSTPGALELLRYLHTQPFSYYTPSALAVRVGLPADETDRLLSSLVQCNLLQSTSLELEDRSDRAYRIYDFDGLVPFLFFSRWIMAANDAWVCSWNLRTRPILAPSNQAEKGSDERKESHEAENT